MKKITKKLCSIVLALCVIFSALFTLPVSAATSSIELGVTYEVTIPADEDHCDMYFTPELSGVYYFRSIGTDDTVAYVYDSEGNEIAYNDDGDIDSNFSLFCELTAGETYTLRTRFLGFSENTYNVILSLFDVDSVHFNNASVIKGQDSYEESEWDDETNEYVYYHYYMYDTSGYFELSDGTIVPFDEGLEYFDEWYWIEYSDTQSHKSPWQVGNSYTVTGELLGHKSTFEVTVSDNPVERIDISEITVTDGFDDSIYHAYDYENDQEVTYKHYNYTVDFTVYLKDGTVLQSEDEAVTINGNQYRLEYYDLQDYNNIWEVNNTYTVNAYFFSFEESFTVTVLENPVESVEIHDVTRNEGDYRGHASFYDDITGEYLEYNYYYYSPTLTVYLKDGTVLQSNQSGSVYINNAWHSPNFDDGQDYYNRWEPGTHTVTASLLGFECTFNVIITEIPDWDYIELEDGIFVTNCILTDDEITVPESIGGKPVTGIIGFGDCLRYAKTINIPDSVVNISPDAFASDYWCNLKTVNIGKNVSQLSADTFAYCDSVCEINVSEQNPSYHSVDGIVYTKPDNALAVYPLGQGNSYFVPDFVTNVDVLYTEPYYIDINISFSENSKLFKKIDGVTYTADMKAVISCDSEKTGTYNMPESVTSIKSGAFEGSQLNSVTISKNVTEIAYYSFAYCENLETVNMPDSISTIDGYAFFGCDLKNLTKLPDQLTTLNSYAFAYTQLNSISIPSGVKEIGNNAFEESSLKNLTLSEGLETIGNSAFYYTNVNELTIPKTVKTIGSSAFCDTNIESLLIPDGVTSIGGGAFSSTPLKTLTIGKGLYKISSGTFSGTQLETLTLPENIKYVLSGGFSGCENLSKVNFMAEEVYLGHYAFSGCPLDQTTIGDNIKTIGMGAFFSNDWTQVKIPDSVTEITYRSFAYGDNLEKIDIPDNIESVDGYAFEGTAWYNAQNDGAVYLEHVLYYYKGDISEGEEVVVKDGTKVIADCAFEAVHFPREEYIDHIEPDKNLNVVPNYFDYSYDWYNTVINDRSGLTTIKLPDSLKAIGRFAFNRCESLTEISLPDGTTTIGEGAFAGCKSLSSITIPKTVTKIGWNAFWQCHKLTIYGYSGSYAETYATQNNIPFVTIVEKSADDVTVIVPNDVINENAQLIVEQVSEDEVVEKLPADIEYTNVSSFDIYFELEGENIQPNGTVTVQMNVPAELNGKYCKVYHLADDGTLTDMNATFKDGKLIFNTDHFSIYVIVENKPAYVSGDVNEDGKINNKDLGLLMQHLNGWNVSIRTEAADVNRDEKINNKDLGLLMQYLNGWNIELK